MSDIIASAEITVTDVKDGVGIDSVVTRFLATHLDKGVTASTGDWSVDPPSMDVVNKYLWSYETITYTDGHKQDGKPAIIGVYGEDGVGIENIFEYYLVSDKSTGILSTDSRFKSTIPTMNETDKYLWKYEEILYTNNERSSTNPVVVGVYGDKGTSIKNIKNYYLATSASSGISRDTDGFKETMQPLSLTNKYLWNYETIEYENPTSFQSTEPVIIGVHGDDGKDGTDAKLLYLSSTLETMSFNADGDALPTSQTATIEAKLQNTSGSISFSAKAYNGTSALSNSIALGGSGNSRTFSVSNFPSNATHVSITATLGSLTDTISIFKLRHGKDAIVGYLTNESITLGANNSGRVGSFTPATGTFRMFDGATEVTTSTSTSYTLENSNGLAAEIDKDTGVYKITAMNSDTATAEFKATYKGVSIFKTVTLSKSIAGEKGETGDKGDSAISAVLTNESITFAANKDGAVQNYVGNTGNFLLIEGTVIQSTGVEFSRISQTNVSATIDKDSGFYTISSMTEGTSATTGQVTFRATYKEASIDKTVTISKSITGQTGAPATSYWLTSSVDTVTVKYNGDYDPKTITYYGHSKTGSNNTQNYTGRFIIQTSVDGVNFTEAYRSPVNMSKVDFSVPEDVLFIKAKFYQAGGTTYLLDEQTTPILHSADGLKGIGLEDKDYQVGTEIYTDKADDSVVHVEVDGKSLGGGSGKNVLRQLFTAYAPYNTVPVWDEGLNKITFTMNATGYIAVAVGGWIPEKKTYTLSGVMKKNGLPVTRNDWRDNRANTTATVDSLSVDDSTGRFEVTQTWINNTQVWILHANFSTTIGDVVTIEDFQMEEGSTATAYEPPAPTPNYPIEIHSLNDFDVVSSVGRRNILLNSEEEVKNNNYNMKAYTPSTPIVEGEEYTTTVCVTPARGASSMQLYLSQGYRIQLGLSFNGTSKQILTGTFSARYYEGRGLEDSISNANVTFYRQPNNGTVTEDTTIHWVKVEKGSKSTLYSPASEDITENDNHPLIDKINLLLSEPLRSVGDVKDRLFKDNDGLWKVNRNIGEVMIDGKSSLVNPANSYQTPNSTIFGIPIDGKYYGKTLSNLLPHIDNNKLYNSATDGVGISLDGYTKAAGRIRFRIPNDWIGISPNDFFKERERKLLSKLSESPLSVIYELEFPFTETLDQELQDKLNNLRSFQEHNYVYTVFPDKTDIISEELKPTLHATFKGGGYYARWKTAYDLEKTTEYIEQEIKRTQNTAWIRAGMRVGYSGFTQTNPNSVYICGLEHRDGYRDMVLVDKPAEIYIRESNETAFIPNQSLSVSGVPSGVTAYIVWDNTKKSLFLTYFESEMTATGVSKKRWRNISGETITFTDSLFAIGEVEV